MPAQRPSGYASAKASGRYPRASVTRVMPWPARCSSTRSIIGRLPTGSICFGLVSVRGRRRVPKPPTRTTACTGPPGGDGRLGRGGGAGARRCGGGRAVGPRRGGGGGLRAGRRAGGGVAVGVGGLA